ncbi:MAG: TonB-dependent receptor [Bacteroidota bacterium]
MMKKFYHFPSRLMGLLLLGSLLFGSGQLAAKTWQMAYQPTQKIRLDRAFDQLARDHKINIIYDVDQVSKYLVKPSGKVAKVTIEIKRLIAKTDLSYTKLNNTTFVIKKDNKTSAIPVLPIQPEVKKLTVGGVIRDKKSKEPLIGANIIERSTSNGVSTDIDGNYSIEVEEDAILEVSYIGYQTKSVRVNGKTSVNIYLDKDDNLLEQVVVIGYGSQKRSDLTGAVDRIGQDELQQLPNTGLEQAIQGRSAGVYITQNSGAPGGAMSVRIRGTGSTLSAEPLYVIDGIPIVNDNEGTSATFESDGGGQYSNALTTINPNDIESIEILKDASATAIYGARAANGVVLITTRKGKEGRATISYDTYWGMQQLYKKVDVMNLREYADYIAISGYGDIEEFQRPELLGEGTNWQDAIFRNANMSNHQLSLTGGTEKTRFSLTGGVHHKEGIVRGSDFTRYSAKLNVDHNFTNYLKIGGNILTSRTRENITFNDNSNGVIYTALLTPPMVPARNLDGTFGTPPAGENVILTFNNPLANALETEDVNRKNRILASLYAEVQFTPWLKYRTEFATDILYSNHSTFWPAFERGNLSRKSRVRRVNNNSVYWINKHLLTFDKTLWENHKITFLAGYEVQEGTYEWLSAARDNLPTNELKELNLGDAGTQVVNGGAGHWALLSYFGRFNYGFKDRYLFTGTLRADGSSRFGANNRYGLFPSAAFAWRISNEEIFSDVSFLDNLKLRLGYGAVGNQEIGLYSFATNLRAQELAFGDQLITGFAPDNIANPDVKWESSVQTNIGLDIGLFNNRLEVIIDAYYKKSKDMLLPAILPRTAGSLNAPFINIGEMDNKGIELTFNTQNYTGAFSWSTSANFSVNRNEVVNLGSTGALTGVIQRIPITRTEEGAPIGQYYGHITDGIFRSLEEIAEAPFQEVGTRPGDIKFKDLNNDGVINDADRTIIGSPHPDFTANLINDFTYKNFDLNIFIRGVFGNEVFNVLKRDLAGTGAWHNQSIDIVDAWTSANPEGSAPRINGNDPNQNRRISDRFVEDGTYIRIQNITLGYTLPANVLERLPISSLRAYISGQNLLTITDYSGYDPEIGSFNQNPLLNGLDNGRFPVARSYTVGVNISF